METEVKNIYQKLLAVQTALKAPKDQENKFGGYKYRSAESILEAVKPLNKEQGLVLFLTDDILLKGDGSDARFYVQATAKVVNVDNPDEALAVTAYAREEFAKKGMDSSQVTGAASSYARKYALNGLFDIDDTKDSDVTNDKKGVTAEQLAKMRELQVKTDGVCKKFQVSKVEDISYEQAAFVIASKERALQKAAEAEARAIFDGGADNDN